MMMFVLYQKHESLSKKQLSITLCEAKT